jgi:hypothetical protein
MKITIEIQNCKSVEELKTYVEQVIASFNEESTHNVISYGGEYGRVRDDDKNCIGYYKVERSEKKL